MEYCHFVSFFVCVSFGGEGKKERAIDLRHVLYYEIICFKIISLRSASCSLRSGALQTVRC